MLARPGRRHTLRNMWGSVEVILDAMRAYFAPDRPVRTASSVYEVMSIRGTGRPRKSPHRAEEPASVRHIERALIRSIVRYEPLIVCRTPRGRRRVPGEKLYMLARLKCRRALLRGSVNASWGWQTLPSESPYQISRQIAVPRITRVCLR